MIDCGVSLKQLVKSLDDSTIFDIDAVVVTHEHSDHVRGLGPLGRKNRTLPIYIHESSFYKINAYLTGVNHQDISKDRPLEIGDICIHPFNLVHDTLNAFGYFFENGGGANFCYMTDTGFLPDEAMKRLELSDVAMIESNYDEQGLIDYPHYTFNHKQRIRQTHLCNSQTLDILRDVGIDRFKKIIMGHLSPRTNKLNWVREGFFNSFPDFKDLICIAPVKSGIEV